MIETMFTLTKAEYIEAQSLFARDDLRLSRKWRWPLAVLFFAMAFVSVMTSQRPLGLGSIPVYTFPLFVMAVVLICIGPLMRRGFAKRYEKEKSNLTNARIWLDDVGYHYDVPGIGAGVAEWAGIQTWREGEQVFMLRSGYLLRVLPKSALSPYEQHQVRELIAAKVHGYAKPDNSPGQKLG